MRGFDDLAMCLRMRGAEGMTSREQWATRIAETWLEAANGMLAAIFKLGGDLIAAKEGPSKLPHGEFIAMVESDLPFKRNTAQRLMAIARDPRLTNGEHVHHLPPSWGTLYQLSRLDDETFGRLLADGIIRPEMERSEVNKVLRISRVETDEQRILKLTPVIGKFRTVVLDPAWEYDWLSTELQKWFWPNHDCWPVWVSEQKNRTECRIVPINEVEAAVGFRRYVAYAPFESVATG